MIHHVTPIPVLHLLSRLDEHFIDFCEQRTEEDFMRPTAHHGRTVQQILSLWLFDTMKMLSGLEPSGRSSATHSHRQQGEDHWLSATREMHPRVLQTMNTNSCRELNVLLSDLDPWQPSILPLPDAGEEIARNWYLQAVMYAKRWMYQQLIRDTFQDNGLMIREYSHPFFETVMCLLPGALKNIDAVTGTSVCIRIRDGHDDEWHVNKTDEGWVLRHSTEVAPLSTVVMDAGIAWKLFCECLSGPEQKARIRITGVPQLGAAALRLTPRII